MSNTEKIWIAVVLTIVVSVLALGICLPDVARADGRIHTAHFVLPFALLTAYNFPDIAWGLVLLLALAQLPCYGVILGFAWVENKVERVWWRLLLYHALLGTGPAIVYCAIAY